MHSLIASTSQRSDMLHRNSPIVLLLGWWGITYMSDQNCAVVIEFDIHFSRMAIGVLIVPAMCGDTKIRGFSCGPNKSHHHLVLSMCDVRVGMWLALNFACCSSTLSWLGSQHCYRRIVSSCSSMLSRPNSSQCCSAIFVVGASAIPVERTEFVANHWN